MAEFRADRLATLYLFHPLRRLLRSTPDGIPILMYHSLSQPGDQYKNVYLSRKLGSSIFAANMNWLAYEGYRTIGVGEAVDRLQTGRQREGKFVALTFDGGFRDVYTHVFPVLQTLQYTATVYLPAPFIGEDRREFRGAEFLTWCEVKQLRQQGIEIGSYGTNSAPLPALAKADLAEQLRAPKQEIEDRLGEPVQSFAYPYRMRRNDPWLRKDFREALVSSGYRTGVCNLIGVATRSSDPLFLERLPVGAGDDPGFFKAKVRGGYNWVRPVQTILGRMRRVGRP